MKLFFSAKMSVDKIQSFLITPNPIHLTEVLSNFLIIRQQIQLVLYLLKIYLTESVLRRENIICQFQLAFISFILHFMQLTSKATVLYNTDVSSRHSHCTINTTRTSDAQCFENHGILKIQISYVPFITSSF